MNDFLDCAASSSNSDVFVATRAILIKLKPIFDASFAKQLIAVIAFLSLPSYFEADLAKNESRELLIYFKAADAFGIVARLLYIHHVLNLLFAFV